MDDFVYRFRPVHRLLAKDGVSGELDGTHIYFAAPEQLNDPLEGYKDIFYNGDNIAWTNVVKHYLRCLLHHVTDHFIDPQGPGSAFPINILLHPEHLPDRLQNIHTKITENFFTLTDIVDFISTWREHSKVRRGELFYYLDMIHIPAIQVIFEHLTKMGFLNGDSTEVQASASKRLEHLRLITEQRKKDNSSDESDKDGLLAKHFRMTMELRLLDKYKRQGKPQLPHTIAVIEDLPEAFCNALEKIIFPSWYTACFMQSCTNSAIWGSYGGNHKDVCLKFRIEKKDTNKGLHLIAPNGGSGNRKTYSINYTNEFFPFHEVSYDREFVSLDFFDSLGQLTQSSLMKNWLMDDKKNRSTRAENVLVNFENWRNEYWKNFYHSNTVKLDDWASEREYRIILTSTINDLTPIELRKVKYNFDSLEGIIFGINTSLEHKCELIARIESLSKKFDRSEFSFYQARYDEKTRKIAIDKLSLLSVTYRNLD